MQKQQKIDFAAFKAGPGGRIAKSLGIPIASCTTWSGFTDAAVRYNDCVGILTNAAKRHAGTASTGEMSVLCAVLHAADFSSQADEIAGTHGWYRLSRTTGDHALAVAACIMRID